MPRIKAIAESAPTSNPIRRKATFNPRHPASKLYTSPSGGSVRLTWSPVNQSWFLLWPGDAPVERQQVLQQFQQWEEGDQEARRITAGGPNPADAPAENPTAEWYVVKVFNAGSSAPQYTSPRLRHDAAERLAETKRAQARDRGWNMQVVVEPAPASVRENPHGDPPGTSLQGFHVILRGGRPGVRVMASSKWDAEQQVRAWGAPELYPIWYILSDEEIEKMNGGARANPRDPGPPLDADYFERVARNFLHPLIMQHPDMQDSQKKVQELAGLLARTAERGRVGRAYR